MYYKKLYKDLSEQLSKIEGIEGNISARVINDTTLKLVWDARRHRKDECRPVSLQLSYNKKFNTFKVMTEGSRQPTVTLECLIIDHDDATIKEIANAISIYILSGSIGRLADFFVMPWF